MRLDPAREIIEKFGDSGVVADILGLLPASVLRWTWPTTQKGGGGRIPHKYHQPLIDAAEMRGINLTLKDFYRPVKRNDADRSETLTSR